MTTAVTVRFEDEDLARAKVLIPYLRDLAPSPAWAGKRSGLADALRLAVCEGLRALESKKQELGKNKPQAAA